MTQGKKCDILFIIRGDKGVAVSDYREMAQSLLKTRPLSTKHLVDDSKVGDHHAIIPTEEPINLARLSFEELTAKWEKDLSLISKGQAKSWPIFKSGGLKAVPRRVK